MGPELSRARYLRACIDESLRLTPPTPGLIPRLVMKGGVVIEGQPIPAGTEVGVAAYTIHLNPAYYPRPFEFLPERWLEESDNESALTLARSAFAAFSTGRHSCVGKELAYMEMTLLVARIVHQYDIKLVGDDETKRTTGEGSGPQGPWGRRVKGQYQILDQFTAKGNGPWIQFRRK
jgi:cytochrome P450